MKQEIVQSRINDTERAADELFSQLKLQPSQYCVVLFFAGSQYDFDLLSKKIAEHFPQCIVAGTMTSGELTQSGFTKNTVVLTALSDTRTKVTGVLIDHANKFPIVYKNDIEQAARRCGIVPHRNGGNRDSFALVFVNGLCNAEESTLALLNTVIDDDSFFVAGGSAGDDLKFKQTAVSYNGSVVHDGAVILFFKTQCTFEICKENIFKAAGKHVTLTGVNSETRTVTSIDGKNPRARYAEMLGIPESKVQDAVLEHPFGRVYGNNTFISSIAGFNSDGSIAMYSRVQKNSIVEILEPMNAAEIAGKTSDDIKKKIPSPGCVLFINCILRTIGFEKKSLESVITRTWNERFPTYCGFSSYGEQFNHLNSNQTLVAIVIGER